MTINLTSIALAAAATVIAPAASALTSAQIAAGPTTYVWLSGSSSVQNAVFRSVISLCNGLAGNTSTKDTDIYLEGAGVEPGKGGGDRVAYACTMSAAAGTALSGKKVVVYHTVEGGSFNAYSPHLSMAGEPNPNSYLPGNLKRVNDLASQGGAGKCAAGSAASTSVTLNGVVYSIGRYNSCDLATIGGEVSTNIGQAFGVAVSYPLYYQLQKNAIASGDIAASCTAAPFTVTAPNLTPACQPGLPAQRYSAIAGRDSVAGVDGSLFGGPTGSVVNLARRVPTSGVQSASNLRFLTKPCATGISGGSQEPARTADGTATAVVTEQSTTEGVKSTLNTATGAGQFALGVISMENTPAPTASADRWAFVKLEGTSPNSDTQQRARAMEGAYTFWYELAAFTANNPVSPASAGGAALILAATTVLTNADLKGIFATPLADQAVPPPRVRASAIHANLSSSRMVLNN